MCQGSEYTRILNTPGFSICQGMKLLTLTASWPVLRVTEGSEYACEYVRLYLDMSEYARICVNIPTSAWMGILF